MIHIREERTRFRTIRTPETAVFARVCSNETAALAWFRIDRIDYIADTAALFVDTAHMVDMVDMVVAVVAYMTVAHDIAHAALAVHVVLVADTAHAVRTVNMPDVREQTPTQTYLLHRNLRKIYNTLQT